MYTDAFKLICDLAQNEKVIKEILITKKGFRVRWTQEKVLFWFKYDKVFEDRVIQFLELYDIYKERV